MQVLLGNSALAVPARLVADTRVEFRIGAFEILDRLEEEGGGALVLDMGETREVDAAGLGILVVVQRRARELGVTTRLLHTQKQIRTVLSLTELDSLFEFEK